MLAKILVDESDLVEGFVPAVAAVGLPAEREPLVGSRQHLEHLVNVRRVDREPIGGLCQVDIVDQRPVGTHHGVDHAGGTDSGHRRGRRPAGGRHHADTRSVCGLEGGDRSVAQAAIGRKQRAVEVAGDQLHLSSPMPWIVRFLGHVGRTLPTGPRSSQTTAQPSCTGGR